MSNEQELQKKYWSSRMDRRHASHPVVEAVFRHRAVYLSNLLNLSGGTRVLDVGCGNGFMTYWLSRFCPFVVGLDFSFQMLDSFEFENRVQASATQLPYADDSFDIVTSSHLLHHLVEEDRIKALREMIRVSKKDVVIYEPNRNNPLMFLFGLLKKEERMSLRFSASYMKQLARSCGASRAVVQTEGLVVPNKAPLAWLPLGKQLEQTPLNRLGFYTRTVFNLSRYEQ